MPAQLRFEKLDLNKPVYFLFVQRTKWRWLSLMYSITCGENQTAFQHKHLSPSVTHDGGGLPKDLGTFSIY